MEGDCFGAGIGIGTDVLLGIIVDVLLRLLFWFLRKNRLFVAVGAVMVVAIMTEALSLVKVVPWTVLVDAEWLWLPPTATFLPKRPRRFI